MGGRKRWMTGLIVPTFLASMTIAGTMLDMQGVPVGDVEVWGTMNPTQRAVLGALRVHVKTPFGRIPITARATATYDCSATFGGALRYSALVRFLARLKGVDLVSQADGAVELLYPWDCAAPPAEFSGRVVIRDTVLTGFLRLGADSIPLNGRTWTVGDSTYHTYIQAQRLCDPFTVQLNLYER